MGSIIAIFLLQVIILFCPGLEPFGNTVSLIKNSASGQFDDNDLTTGTVCKRCFDDWTIQRETIAKFLLNLVKFHSKKNSDPVKTSTNCPHQRKVNRRITRRRIVCRRIVLLSHESRCFNGVAERSHLVLSIMKL